MNKRLQYIGVGTAMAAMLGVGSLTGHSAFAQSATQTPSASTSTTTIKATTATDRAAARKAEYDTFVAKLATQLGISDSTKVDTAIKDVLKQQVDEQFTAGDISQNEATAIKARIDAGDVGPLGFGHGMGMGMDGPRGGKGGRMHGNENGNGQGNDNGNGGADTETVDGTPAPTS